jgi:hypothetical protein
LPSLEDPRTAVSRPIPLDPPVTIATRLVVAVVFSVIALLLQILVSSC